MRIEEAVEKDLQEINRLVKKEFPYVERSEGELLEKIKTERVLILKAVEGKQMLGFVEIEFLESAIARINGLNVKPGARDKGAGKKLLQAAIKELEKKNMARILLLVKQSNKKAKALYKKAGFEFIGLYHRRLDNEVIEEMELDLQGEQPSYVS